MCVADASGSKSDLRTIESLVVRAGMLMIDENKKTKSMVLEAKVAGVSLTICFKICVSLFGDGVNTEAARLSFHPRLTGWVRSSNCHYHGIRSAPQSFLL